MRRGVLLTAMTLCLGLAGAAPLAATAGETDDVGMYGSITVQRHAGEAAASYKKGDYARAQGEYRTLIGLEPKEKDFYFGLYESSYKLQQWDQVGLALEELFDLDPSLKDKMILEYAECLYHQNRYDEAEPMLKKALAHVDEPSIVDHQIKKLMTKSIIKHEKVIGAVAAPLTKPDFTPVKREELAVNEVRGDTSKSALNFDNAFRSESIVIAEFKKWEKNGDMVTYYHPPKAIYHIDDILKGPPLNPTLPVRYEFHEKINAPKPKDWKFDNKTTMPEKGSKWIIFIENAVPIDGMFETYHGSYGRQVYNEENYDKIMRIIDRHKGQTR